MTGNFTCYLISCNSSGVFRGPLSPLSFAPHDRGTGQTNRFSSAITYPACISWEFAALPAPCGCKIVSFYSPEKPSGSVISIWGREKWSHFVRVVYLASRKWYVKVGFSDPKPKPNVPFSMWSLPCLYAQYRAVCYRGGWEGKIHFLEEKTVTFKKWRDSTKSTESTWKTELWEGAKQPFTAGSRPVAHG